MIIEIKKGWGPISDEEGEGEGSGSVGVGSNKWIGRRRRRIRYK